MKNPLEHLIPDPWFEQDYLSRTVDGVRDIDWLDAMERLGFAVLIGGPTGSGKTSAVYAWAARERLPVVNIPCSRSLESDQLTGRWVSTGDGEFDFAPGDLPLALKETGGIVLFDEVDRVQGDTLSAFHSLTDKRQSISIPEAAGSSFPTEVARNPGVRFIVIGTYNPDYGHRPLDPATKNRFQAREYWDYDPDIERQLVPESDTLHQLADSLRQARRLGDIDTETPTNALVEFAVITESLSLQAAVGNLCRRFDRDEQEVVRATVQLHCENLARDFGVDTVPTVHLAKEVN